MVCRHCTPPVSFRVRLIAQLLAVAVAMPELHPFVQGDGDGLGVFLASAVLALLTCFAICTAYVCSYCLPGTDCGAYIELESC